ncbi:MAG: thioredoxin-dependent thiol peroxidase [Kiritimatiellae bacterium]|nr:thioredoxin-dependent thiol peroxidase [Kiritimatiellia bacterium]
MSLEIGQPAPAFELPDQHGRKVSLSSLRGHKTLIYFYPKADTPGCTKQACALRDALDELGRAGVAVVGISPDPPAAQERFDVKYRLGFPLLSDEDHQVAAKYGAWGEKTMYGKTSMGMIRSAFLLDEEGRVIAAWVPIRPEETVPNVLAALTRC